MAKSNKQDAGAKSDYENSMESLRAKTEKLKALRLARDAANPPPVAAPKRSRKSKAPSGKLSDWLSEQAKEGRRS